MVGCPACGGVVEATADPGLYRCAEKHRLWDRAEGVRPGEVPFGYSDTEWAEVEPAYRASYRPTLVLLVSPTPARTEPRPAPKPAPRPQGQLFAVPDAPPERKKIDALSPSSAGLFGQCPRRFEFEKVLGRRSPPGEPATAGKYIHKVLELVTDLPLAERTVETARPIASRLWADAMAPVDAPVEFQEADAADVVELRRDLVHLKVDVKAFKGGVWSAVAYAMTIEAEYGGEIAHRELNLWNTTVAGVPFRGKADRVDRYDTGLVVVDYKSGKATVKDDGSIDQDKLDEKAEQLLWYWDAIGEKTGELVVGALLAYIGAGAQVRLWVDDRRLELARKKFARVWSDLHRYEARAPAEPYKAKPSFLCGWCPFWKECRDGSEFLLDKLTWADGRPRKGKPLPPFRAEMQGWSSDRHAAWVDFARGKSPAVL